MLMEPETKAAPVEKPAIKKAERKRILITDISKKGKFFSINRLLDAKDRNAILQVAGIGIALNFALFCIFKTGFNWYSWIGWGLGMWIIEKRIPKFIKEAFR